MGELARVSDSRHGAYGRAMTDRWDAFTEDEREAIVEALDYFIAREDHTAEAVALYDELVAHAGEDGDE